MDKAKKAKQYALWNRRYFDKIKFLRFKKILLTVNVFCKI